MTTSDEAIQLIQYLRDHRFIGEDCWADEAETERDHEGYECQVEILDYPVVGDRHAEGRPPSVGRPHVPPDAPACRRTLAEAVRDKRRPDGGVDAIPPCTPTGNQPGGGRFALAGWRWMTAWPSN